MLNPQTEIKFSDYNSLYDILNPTVNGFRDFSLSFLIDYKAGASLFSGTNYSLYSEGLHKGTLLGRTVDNPGGSGFIGAGVMIDDNGKILGENNVAVNAQDYHKGSSTIISPRSSSTMPASSSCVSCRSAIPSRSLS
ncbi:hypothetical protein M5E82_13330 [Parabacteroides distasonis]|nr:hypothetical protein M5E82_13330 [Parabacteroides distasonis]